MNHSTAPTAEAPAVLELDGPEQLHESIVAMADQIHQLRLQCSAQLGSNDRLKGICSEVLAAMESSLHRGQTDGLLPAIQQLRLVLAKESQ